MATTEPQLLANETDRDDVLFRKIFLSTLHDSEVSDQQVVYLKATAAVISDTQGAVADLMMRVLFKRTGNLIPPEIFQFTIDTYRRACEEEKNFESMQNGLDRHQIQVFVNQAKELCAGYFSMCMTTPLVNDLVSHPVLSFVFSELSSDGGSRCPGFLNMVFNYTDEAYIHLVYQKLKSKVYDCSALVEFQEPLRALMYLVSFPAVARALDHVTSMLPFQTGRTLELANTLGTFFHISALPNIPSSLQQREHRQPQHHHKPGFEND